MASRTSTTHLRSIRQVALAAASVTFVFSCQTGSATLTRTINAQSLAEKYNVSVEAARREFDGKELLLEGYVLNSIAVPKDDGGEGMVLLGSERSGAQGVQCWFTRYQATEFSGLERGSLIKVKGLFNGEAGPALKFCKLVQRNGR